jgi:hypothetical protein
MSTSKVSSLGCLDSKALKISAGPRQYTEDGATFVCLGVSNSGGGQGFLTRQISSKAHISYARPIGEVWIFPSAYLVLTGFSSGKNLDYQLSAKQSMHNSLDTVINRFLCTSINQDSVRPSQFNRDSSFGRPSALKVVLITIYCRFVHAWFNYLCDEQEGIHDLKRQSNSHQVTRCFCPTHVHPLVICLLRLLGSLKLAPISPISAHPSLHHLRCGP